MRFFGTWVASLLAVALVATLVLGRDEPPRTYELAAITEAFEARYATALADLEAGGVLYLRSEQRSAPDEDGEFTSLRAVETWVGTSDSIPIARSEESNALGEVIRVIDFNGPNETVLTDRVAGTTTRDTAIGEPAQTPGELLAQLRARSIGAASSDSELIGTAPIAGLEAARIAGPEPLTSETAFAVADPIIHLERALTADDGGTRVVSELALVAWTVLPAGTPLGTRPD